MFIYINGYFVLFSSIDISIFTWNRFYCKIQIWLNQLFSLNVVYILFNPWFKNINCLSVFRFVAFIHHIKSAKWRKRSDRISIKGWMLMELYLRVGWTAWVSVPCIDLMRWWMPKINAVLIFNRSPCWWFARAIQMVERRGCEWIYFRYVVFFLVWYWLFAVTHLALVAVHRQSDSMVWPIVHWQQANDPFGQSNYWHAPPIEHSPTSIDTSMITAMQLKRECRDCRPNLPKENWSIR